jgi:hypothetical protein
LHGLLADAKLDPLVALSDERLMEELQGGIAERRRLLELQLEQVTKLKEERQRKWWTWRLGAACLLLQFVPTLTLRASDTCLPFYAHSSNSLF